MGRRAESYLGRRCTARLARGGGEVTVPDRVEDGVTHGVGLALLEVRVQHGHVREHDGRRGLGEVAHKRREVLGKPCVARQLGHRQASDLVHHLRDERGLVGYQEVSTYG